MIPSIGRRRTPRGALTLAALASALLLGACDKGGTGASSSGGDGTPDALLKALDAGMALPQEELARKEGVVRLKGTLVVSGESTGRLQIDVFRVAQGPQRPVTTARFDKPGPFEIFLPRGIGKVELIGLIDFGGDGPDARDPRSPYAKNPIDVGSSDVEGIELTLDAAAVVPTPPPHPPPQPVDPNGAGAGPAPENLDTSDSSEIILRPDGKPDAPPAEPAPSQN